MSYSDIRGTMQRYEFADDTVVIDEFKDGAHNDRTAVNVGSFDNRKAHAKIFTAFLLRNFLHVIWRSALVSMDVVAFRHLVMDV